MEDFDVVIDSGSLGVSLCALRSGTGAFVDSQYDDGSDRSHTWEITAGDRLLNIQTKDVSAVDLFTIRDWLSNAPRPMSLRFRRYVATETAAKLFDQRWKSWLEQYLKVQTDHSAKELSERMQIYKLTTLLIDYFASGLPCDAKPVQLLSIECIMFCICQFESSDVPQALRDCVDELVTTKCSQDSGKLLNALCAANSFLSTNLEDRVLLPFQQSSFSARAAAYLSESPSFYRATLSEVLDDGVLSACYFLFLSQLRRHQCMGAYLRCKLNCLKTNDSRSPRSSKAAVRRQTAAVEATCDGLLHAFYASGIYELILTELSACTSTDTGACSSSRKGGGPWRAGSLQRLVRATAVPEGIALHRGAGHRAEPPSQSVFEVIQLDSHQVNGSTEVVIDVVRSVCWPHEAPVVASQASLLQYLTPTDGCAGKDPTRIINYVIAQKTGPVLYGATLLHYRPCINMCFSPERAALLDVEADTHTAVSADSSSTPFASESTDATRTRGEACAAAGSPSRSDWLATMLQRAAIGIRSGVVDPTPVRPGYFGIASMPAALPLSPFMRAVGLRPAAPIPARRDGRATFSPSPSPAWALRSPLSSPERWAGSAGSSRDPDQTWLVRGTAVVTTVPTVGLLRVSLLQHEVDGCLEALRDVTAESINNAAQPPGTAAPGVASDFCPQALYEVLGPSALATIFAAFLVECRIVVVADQSPSVVLLLGEWMRQAVHPLQWCHVYSPVVHADVAVQLLQCPAPYFLGITNRALRRSAHPPPADALVVELDSGRMQMPESLRKIMLTIKPLELQLSRALRPAYHSLESTSSVSDVDVRQTLFGPQSPISACRTFVMKLLTALEKCSVVLDEQEELLVALDEVRFLRKSMRWLAPKDSDERDVKAAEELVKLFLRTQACSEHVLKINNNDADTI